MSSLKINKLAMVVAAGTIISSSLSGCVTVNNYKQELFGMDKSSREPTGYYEYTKETLKRNTLVVPQGLDNPGTNPELKVLNIDPSKLKGPVGKDLDVRPPTAPYRSDIGLHTQWSSGEAIVWFDKNGTHGIHSEDQAWMLLDSVLKHMQVKVGHIENGQYLLTTLPRDFNEYGQPYSVDDEDMGLIRYSQVYQVRVGRNAQGEIGIASRLIANATALSNSHSMDDALDAIEQERFAMGFSNQIIHELGPKNVVSQYDPDNLVVSLGRDNNNHDAIFIEAPFDTVLSILPTFFKKVGWSIKSHSVEQAKYEIEVIDSEDDVISFTGKQALSINHGTYKIRVGIHGDNSAITFYDKEDRPIPSEAVAKLYPGFADVISEVYSSMAGGNSATVVVAK